MKIPSPRSFIEIAAFCLLGLCIAFGMIGAFVLLAVFYGIEKVVDSVRQFPRREAGVTPIQSVKFRRHDPSAETAPAGETGSSHSTAGAEELRGGR